MSDYRSAFERFRPHPVSIYDNIKMQMVTVKFFVERAYKAGLPDPTLIIVDSGNHNTVEFEWYYGNTSQIVAAEIGEDQKVTWSSLLGAASTSGSFSTSELIPPDDFKTAVWAVKNASEEAK